MDDPGILARAVHTLGAAVCLLTLLAGAGGCRFGALPAPGSSRNPLSDDAGPDVPAAHKCVPNTSSCENGQVKECSDDGMTVTYRDCLPAEACVQGACRPIPKDCQATAQGERGEFSISASRLVFETRDDLKSSSDSLDITNCSDAPITIKSLTIQQANSRGQSDTLPAMFELEKPSPILLTIPPGGVQSVGVRYQPQFAFSREAAKLQVGLIASHYRRFDVALVPKTYCVTVTPSLDLGLVEDNAARWIVVQNCGTEPVTLENIHAEPAQPQATQHAEFDLSVPHPLPVLAPSAHLRIPFEVHGLSAGPFDQKVLVGIAEAPKFPSPTVSSTISGRIAAGTCHRGVLAAPTVWTDRLAPMSQWRIPTIQVGEKVHIQLPQAAAPDDQRLVRLHAPAGSRSVLNNAAAGASLDDLTLTPDVAGRYRVELNAIDAQGEALCEAPQLTLDAMPSNDLYVDLEWYTHGDAIPDDVGYGRGADLNLHVAATEKLTDPPQWADPVFDCFGYGVMPLPETNNDALRSKPFGCRSPDGQEHATIRSLSVSGAHHEIITVDDAGDDFYHIGVKAFSMYDFPQVTARLTIYAHGRPVDQIVLPSDWWDGESVPDDVDSLSTRELHANDVWIYGIWDASRNKLYVYPPRYYPFFPQP